MRELARRGAWADRAGGRASGSAWIRCTSVVAPSLLEPEQMSAIFAAIRGEFEVETAAEITLEAAPGQIGEALLEEALRLGVNRLSLGVQSFVIARRRPLGGRTRRRAAGRSLRGCGGRVSGIWARI